MVMNLGMIGLFILGGRFKHPLSLTSVYSLGEKNVNLNYGSGTIKKFDLFTLATFVQLLPILLISK